MIYIFFAKIVPLLIISTYLILYTSFFIKNIRKPIFMTGKVYNNINTPVLGELSLKITKNVSEGTFLVSQLLKILIDYEEY